MTDKNVFEDIAPIAGSDDPKKNVFADVAPLPERSPIKDLGLSLAKGVVDVGESAVGVADAYTGGAAGNALENAGISTKAAREHIDEAMSPAAQQDAQAVNDAKGFLPTVAAVAKRPFYLGNVVAESIPSMAASVAVGRGAQKIAPGMSAAAAGGIGEGVVSAGQTAEQIRQDTGTLDDKGTIGAVGSGTIVGLTGGAANVAARAAHVALPSTMGLMNRGLDKVEGSFLARRAKAGVIEGAEEVVQSAVEQIGQNYGTGKPLDEGVGQQAAIGGMAGAAMGVVGSAGHGKSHTDANPQHEQNDPSVSVPVGPLQAAAKVGESTGMVPGKQAAGEPPAASQPPSGMGGNRGLIYEAAVRNGVDPRTALVISSIETGGRFNPDAKNPESSASGMFQFMEATRKMFPEVTPEQWADPKVQAEYGAKFIAATNAKMAQALGREPTPGEAYMGHLLGAYGASQLLTADPNAPVQDVVASYDPKRAAEIVRLNGMKGLTAGEAVDKWTGIADKHAQRLTGEEKAIPFSTKENAQMAVNSAAREGRTLEVVDHPTSPGRFAALPPMAGDPNEAQPASKVPLIADLPRYDENPNEKAAADQQPALSGAPVAAAGPAAEAAAVQGVLQGQPVAGAGGQEALPVQQAGGNGGAPAAAAANAAQPAAVGQAGAATASDPDGARAELIAKRGLVPGQDYNPNPTPAQAEAGNYKKVHESFEGLPVTLENPVGSTRRGVTEDGTPWESHMTEADYGYVKRTRGADTKEGGKPEQVDLYVAKERVPNAPVFVFDQHHLDGDGVASGFDEHKAVAGAATLERAQQIYDSGFSDQSGPLRRAEATQMSMPEFKAWLKGGNTDSMAAAEAAPQMRDAQAVNDGVLPPSIDFGGATQEKAFSGAPEAAKFAADVQTAAAQPQELTHEDHAAVADLNTALAHADFAEVAPLRSAPSPESALVAAVAQRVFGTRVVHVEAADGFSGVTYKGRVYLAANEQYPAAFTIGHEVTHTVEGSKVHDVLRDVFRTFGQNPEQQVSDRQQFEQASDGRPISRQYAENEVVADMNGSMWVDPKFWSELASRDESVFRQVAYKFMELGTKALNVVRGVNTDTNAFVSDVEGARTAIAQAWADHLNAKRSAKATGTDGQPQFSKDTNVFAGLMPPKPAPADDTRYSQIAAPDSRFFKTWRGKSDGNPLVSHADGTARVMFHGTSRDISTFKAKQAGAIFVTPKPQFAEDFASASENYLWEHYLGELSGEQRRAAKEAALADVQREVDDEGMPDDEAAGIVEAIQNDDVEHNAFAQDFLRPHVLNSMPSRGNVMPVWARAEKTWNYEDEAHRREIGDFLARERAADSNWTKEKAEKFSDDMTSYLKNGDWAEIERPDVQKAIKASGYDSFTVYEGGTKNLAVYDPNQLKSVTGNNGKFSRKNDDLRFSKKDVKDIELPPKLLSSLTAPEVGKLRRDVATRLVALFDKLPSPEEMAAVAWAGKSARGWYADSSKAIVHVFGPDANRFTALLAALSPQTSVQMNLQNASRIWAGWIAAGRPTERSAIFKVMGDNVVGNKLGDSVLDAWVNNSVRALSTPDPETLVISGPKVNSFMQNLRGNVQEVTNDAWMASFAGVDQKLFAGRLNAKGTDPGKSSGYLAMSARVRLAAQTMSSLTGDAWTPVEVQETIWSWAKTLYEMQESREGGYGAREILHDGALRDELIAATPEFSSLLLEKQNGQALGKAGYGQRIDGLRTLPGLGRGAAVAGAASQKGPFAARTQQGHERAAADRLEQLRDQRARDEKNTRAGAVDGLAFSKLSNQSVFEVAPDPRNTALKADWDALSNNAKWTISRHVARDVLPIASNAVGITGRLRTQLGGYGPDSNPSMSVVFDDNADPVKIDQLTRVLGSALSQQSMMRTSPTPFPGSFEMNAIVVNYPKGFNDQRLHELYTSIREIKDDKGEPYATGHTTAEGAMVILDDGSRISGEDFVAKLAEHLGEPFDVSFDTIHAAFPEAGDNDYGLAGSQQQQGDQRGQLGQATAGEGGAEASLRQTADQLREVAQRRLQQDVAVGKAEATAAEGLKFSRKPVGENITHWARAADDKKVFYSALVEHLGKDEGKKLPAIGWKAEIKSAVNKGLVKADEVKWSGVEEWLDMQQGKVPALDVAAFVARNGVRIEETMLGGPKPELPADLLQHEATEVELVDENSHHWVFESDTGQTTVPKVRLESLEPNSEARLERAKAQALQTLNDRVRRTNRERIADHERAFGPRPTQFDAYTVDGGENYRELLLQLPPNRGPEPTGGYVIVSPSGKRMARVFESEDAAWNNGERHGISADHLKSEGWTVVREHEPRPEPTYTSSHFEQPNVLAHVRMKDRVDSEGKKTLFIEELQSDWGKEVRKNGMGNTRVPVTLLRAVEDPFFPPEHLKGTPGLKEYVWKVDGGDGTGYTSYGTNEAEAKERLYQTPYFSSLTKTGAPAAPFVHSTDAWLALALKRIVKYAADHGYERVAFANGDQNAAHYDLAKTVNKVEWINSPGEGGSEVLLKLNAGSNISLYHVDGKVYKAFASSRMDTSSMKGRMLDEIIGKELATRILQTPPEQVGSAEGLDLSVGAEGMKKFYDGVVPSVLSKLLPKLGGDPATKTSLAPPWATKWTVDEGPGGDVRYFANRNDAVAHAIKEGFDEHYPTPPQPGAKMDGQQLAFDVTDKMMTEVAGGVPMFLKNPAMNSIKAVSVTDIGSRIKGKWTDLRKLSLSSLGGRQLADVYKRDLPQLGKYAKLAQMMQAGVNKNAAKADELAVRWGKLKDERAVSSLMTEATLAHVDPAKDYVKGDSESQYRELRAKWDKLTPEAQQVYRDVRDMYEEHYASIHDAVRERIERAELSSPKKSEMLSRMQGEFFGRVQGVYFPLARFGQYVVTVRDAEGKVAGVSRAETKREADTLRMDLKTQYGPGYTISAVMKAADFNAKRDAVSTEFLGKLFKVLDETGIGEDLQDDINQLVLSSMPEVSWAKHGIHRKGTPGFSQDSRRAFAQNMTHGASYLQRLRYGDRLEGQLREAEKYVKGRAELTESVKEQQVLDEMRKRHELMMNPQTAPWASALTSFGFFFHLGLSPASALVNMTQTPMIAYPILAGRFKGTHGALTKASIEVMQAKNDLTKTLKGDELAAIQRAIDEGTIDVTLAHDLVGIAQGEDSGIMWKVRPVMRAASWMFHHAERFNRQATFLAAYRLGVESGMSADAAFDTATDLTYKAHFDYSSSNRPSVMQGNMAKVFLQFKQYSQNVTFTLANSVRESFFDKSLPKEEVAAARRTLGGLLVMAGASAGALGVPVVAQLLSLASMVGGSDDEPWDAKVALQNYLADTFGAKVADVLMHGVSRLGPADISGRVSLDLYKLWFPDVNEALDGQKAYETFLAGMAGPVIGGVVGNAAKAFELFSEGHTAEAYEALAPSALRGPLRAMRFATEGAKTKEGIPIKDEVSAPGIASQALGFRPSEVASAQEGRSAIMAQDKRLTKRRGELLDEFARPAMSGDDTSSALDAIQKWNEANPNRVIAGMHLQQAVAMRSKRIAQSELGVYLPPKKRDLLEEGRFAAEQ